MVQGVWLANSDVKECSTAHIAHYEHPLLSLAHRPRRIDFRKGDVVRCNCLIADIDYVDVACILHHTDKVREEWVEHNSWDLLANLVLQGRQLLVRICLVDWVRQFNRKLHNSWELVPNGDEAVNAASDDLVEISINDEDVASMANSAFCVYLVVVVFVRFSPQHYLAAPSACHQPKFSHYTLCEKQLKNLRPVRNLRHVISLS